MGWKTDSAITALALSCALQAAHAPVERAGRDRAALQQLVGGVPAEGEVRVHGRRTSS